MQDKNHPGDLAVSGFFTQLARFHPRRISNRLLSYIDKTTKSRTVLTGVHHEPERGPAIRICHKRAGNGLQYRLTAQFSFRHTAPAHRLSDLDQATGVPTRDEPERKRQTQVNPASVAAGQRRERRCSAWLAPLVERLDRNVGRSNQSWDASLSSQAGFRGLQ